MFSLEGFNKLNISAKFFVGYILLLAPFWYLILYTVNPRLILDFRLDIPLVYTLCITISCLLIAILPALFFGSYLDAVKNIDYYNINSAKEEINHSNESSSTKNIDEYRSIEIDEPDILFILILIFSIILASAALLYVKFTGINNLRNLLYIIIELGLYFQAFGIMLKGQVAFRGGCVLASILHIIAVSISICTFFYFH